VWNEDFRIEVPDDLMLQDNPVEFKVWDENYYSADDAIGVVLVDLNCLLQADSPGKISGWFPIYDTFHGVRGQLRISLKLQFFGDVNPFKDSSAGLQFFGGTHSHTFAPYIFK
jgi:Ca2+-dependent lipid-binding protein